jgi:WD40 repeat protein/predicted Ser/Thr protein kinase
VNPDTQAHPVRRLFDAAADLPPAERPAFLDRNCTDPAVRRLVEQMLVAADGASSGGTGPQPTDTDATQPRTPAPLPTIPGYEIVEELGRGGMGVVYLARDTQLDRLVAIKMSQFHGLPDGAKERRRFRTEAEAMARLKHANIVPVHHTAEVGGEPYFVMEYCAGGSLEERARGTAGDPRECARLVELLARAVAAAHAQGVLHRDLKPANVLLDAGGQPRIADFGLARKLDDASRTQSAEVVGTPSYMAPEQAVAAGAVSFATDVYALGAVLYALLTGRPPFQGRNVLDTLQQVLHREPVPPRRLRPVVLRDLDTICLKCLEKEPHRRYASAAALAEDLARFLAGTPIHARPVGAAERAWKWVRREPVKAALGAVVVVAAVALTVVFAVYSRNLAEAESARDEGKQKTQAAVKDRDEQKENAAQARKEEEAAKAKERQAKLEAETRKTRGHLDQGLQLCSQGEIGPGLLWLAEALQCCPPEAPELEHVIRVNLAAWARVRGGLRGRLAPPNGVWTVALSPDGKTALVGTGAAGNMAADVLLLWDVATGQVFGKPLVHAKNVTALAFNRDGKRLASADNAGNVYTWDTATGERVGKPCRHEQSVTALAISPDGTRVVSGSWDKTTRLWTVQTGASLVLAAEGKGWATAAAFSPDGARVLAGGNDNRAWLWEANTGKRLAQFEVGEFVNRVGFLPDGMTPFTLTGTTLRRWDPDTGRPRNPPVQPVFPGAMAFHPSGNPMAARASDSANLWDLATDTLVLTVKQSGIEALAFRADGAALLVASRRELRLWNAVTGVPLGPELLSESKNNGAEKGGAAVGAAVAPGGLAAATCDASYHQNGAEARLWFPPATALAGPALTQRSLVEGLYFLPDRRTCLVYAGDARLYDVAIFTPRGAPIKTGGSQSPRGHSPDGKLFVTGLGHDVYLWDTATGKQHGPPLRHAMPVLSAAFSPDGKRLLTGGGLALGGEVRLWNTDTGELIGAPLKTNTQVGRVLLSPSGKTFAAWVSVFGIVLGTIEDGPRQKHILKPDETGPASFLPGGDTLLVGSGNTIRRWDAATGKQVEAGPLADVGGVKSLALSADGARLLTVGEDRTARVWDLATGQPIGEPLAHPDGVTVVCFSPDGKRVVTGCKDRFARVWDVATGKRLGPPLPHVKWLRSLAVHPDGNLIATGGDDKVTQFWRLPEAATGTPERLRLWVQVLTNRELDNGAVRVLDAKTWHARRAALEKLGGLTAP